MHRIPGFIFLLVAALYPCPGWGLQSMEDINPDIQPPMKIDPERVAAGGIRVLKGRHVTLYTDLPASELIDSLPVIFDAAVPKWCEYFGFDPEKAKPWRLNGFVMRDKDRFDKAGLVPADLPEFPAGINRGHEFWIFIQPDDYYTRHLMLHEGTHAFMGWFCGGLGAPWYAEGMAELLGLHQWKDGKMILPFRPQSKTQTSGWGRPKLIKEWLARNSDGKNQKSLRDVFSTPNRAFRDVESYAWGWAACEFLSRHPLSKDKFPLLWKRARLQPGRFNARVQATFDKSADQLESDWAFFVRDMDYGADPSQSALSTLEPIKEGTFKLAADRSWQSFSLPVNKGDQFRVTAAGRFIVRGARAEDGKPWRCEAGGVSIEYFRGRRLGELQAFVVPQEKADDVLAKLCQSDPVPIGVSNVITADQDGQLCFRINEAPSAMADNEGFLELAIEKIR